MYSQAVTHSVAKGELGVVGHVQSVYMPLGIHKMIYVQNIENTVKYARDVQGFWQQLI